jgi:hypothetical protein
MVREVTIAHLSVEALQGANDVHSSLGRSEKEHEAAAAGT